VTVAVIDSGFDVGHPDRPSNLRLGCDYVAWGALGYAGGCPVVSGDENGHGTHVAGIVAARQNNALGVSGLAPGVTLLAIRTGNVDGASYVSDIASAIREATDAGARVINLSLGGPDRTTTERRAIDYALGRGVVVVAAAGNRYEEGNSSSYPAAFPGVIAVASASDTDQHAFFSNTGSYVSISAPGGSATSSADPDPRHWIVSLFPIGRRGVPQTGYMALIGTSQATPHVAAAAGLIFSVDPQLSGAAAANLLRSTARPLGAPRPNDTFGYGYLDAGAAVLAARAGDGTAPAPLAPSPTPTRTPTPTPARTPTALATPAPGCSSYPSPGQAACTPTPTPACPSSGAALCRQATPSAARVFIPLSSRLGGGGGGGDYPGPGR
jgi:subtilisin family serine protease